MPIGVLSDFKRCSVPRRLAKLTHFCSRKSTHTGNTICACLPAGKNRHAPPPCFCFLVTRSFFPNQFTLRRPATARRRGLAAVQVIPVYKWCWVTLGEQSRVISRECRRAGLPKKK